MSEHNPATFDLDAFISGGSRPERTTVVYANNSLFADLDQARALLAKHEGADQESLGGGSGTIELEAQIAELVEKLEASQCVVRVQALEVEELEEIQHDAETAVKDEADKAAAKAREIARIYCKREGIITPKDINERVRMTSREAYQRIFQRENAVLVLNRAIIEPVMDIPTTRRFLKTVGDAQTAQIWNKFTEARTMAPKVNVPL